MAPAPQMNTVSGVEIDNGTHTAGHSGAGLFTESEVRHSANSPAAGVAAAATVLSASQPACQSHVPRDVSHNDEYAALPLRAFTGV